MSRRLYAHALAAPPMVVVLRIVAVIVMERVMTVKISEGASDVKPPARREPELAQNGAILNDAAFRYLL